jgi:hypothetical protein
MPNNAIVFSDDDDVVWCDSCDARLYELKDGSMICTNGNCGRLYQPGSVNKHKRHLQPIESPYDDTDIPLVPLREWQYGHAMSKRKKKTSILDKEERMWLSQGSGRSITDVQEWLPEGQDWMV